MNHELAQKTNMIDQYLLDELNETDRVAFEEHMFDCPECAQRVRSDFRLVNTLKEVLREEAATPVAVEERRTAGWREWFRPMMLAPTFAALALAIVVGYQNFVSIPGMLQPQVFESKPIVAATRGVETANTIVVRPGAAMAPVSFAVFSPQVHAGYVCEFSAPGRGMIQTVDCGQHKTAEFTLNLLLPSAKFTAGEYTMILRPAADKQAEISRYSFVIKN